MNGVLAGEVALVTGASRGIGRAIAEAFAAAGASVVLAARDRAALADAAAACGARATPLVLDVTDEDACAGTVRATTERFGRLDALVLNAGIAESAPLARTDTALLRRHLTMNLEAPFWLARAAVPGMVERGHGSVIAIASLAARAGFAYVSAYCASKHALLGLMRALAAEHPAAGVTFNCICPHYVDTPMTQATVANIVARTGRTEAEALAPLLTPQGRLVQPGEIAALAVHLASPAARGITGQAINVDGGQLQG